MIDMSDEGGRRQLIMIFRAFILSPTLEEGLVGGVMKQLSRAFENEREFVRLVMEILADVREPMDIFMSEEAEVNFAAQVLNYFYFSLLLLFISIPISIFRSVSFSPSFPPNFPPSLSPGQPLN